MKVNEVYEGDCIEAMRGLPNNSVDTILTDPPYEISFMSKSWDGKGIAFDTEVWRECLRVIKPGGTLMAFGGTRTHHRLMVAIEDAGWEIRDVIMYLYGSGFPKSHNVSIAIDRASGSEREVLNEYQRDGRSCGIMGEKVSITRKITAPATPLAKQFDGYGTALKPAYEPIIMAMKPMGQSYADNAKEWGLAGLWIDGARVEANGESLQGGAYSENGRPSPMSGDNRIGASLGMFQSGAKPKSDFIQPKGRFPANIIHDNSDEVEAEFAKVGVSVSEGGLNPHGQPSPITVNGGFREAKNRPYFNYQDKGTPSRYFQQCPPDPTDNPCLDCQECLTDDEPEAAKGRWPANIIHDGSDEVLAEFGKAGVRSSGGGNGHRKATGRDDWGMGSKFDKITTNEINASTGSASRYFQQCPPDPTQHPEAARFHYCPKAGKKERGEYNKHPTVKPLSLLKYLCRLTRTPTGGIVLDPFAGSGTTAIAAIAEGRDYIIIEKEPEYVEIIKRRIAEYTGETIAPKEIETTQGETANQMSLW